MEKAFCIKYNTNNGAFARGPYTKLNFTISYPFSLINFWSRSFYAVSVCRYIQYNICRYVSATFIAWKNIIMNGMTSPMSYGKMDFDLTIHILNYGRPGSRAVAQAQCTEKRLWFNRALCITSVLAFGK